MSTFKISNVTSTSLTVTSNPNSTFVKHFKNLSDLSISGA